MKKKNFMNLLLGVMGGLLFALGMCMRLIVEWNSRTPGLVFAVAGMAALLLLAKNVLPQKAISLKMVGKVLYGVLAFMTLGIGMCLVLVWQKIVWGIIVGLLGTLLILLLIPMCIGLK